MYIKVFTDGAAVIISEEQDRPCSNPQGHDFNPESGAMFGDNGNCCSHCGHFVGRHEEMRDAEEAQTYAQAMLGAVGPVEVRGTEWKWGPGDVPKSSVMSATNALTTSLISAAPDLLEALIGLLNAPDPDEVEDATPRFRAVMKAHAAIAKATGGTRHA